MAASSLRRNINQIRNAGNYAEDASKLIRENMKCPVCLEVLLPPIYQCETGHNICHLCVDEVSECPLCKSDYGDTRNYFAEELVNSMSFPCKYQEYGCHKTLLGSQLKDHQAVCECQPYRCPELACQEVIGIHQIGKHLDKHGFKVMKGDVHQASVEILDDHFERKTEYNPWRISAFGTEFYAVSSRSREGLWHFWAYGLGLQKDLRKYSYEIVLYSGEKQIMYRGIIQSLRNNPEDIMKNGNCLITNDQMIKSLRKGGRINCQVYFIQGKNWDAARGARCSDAKRSTKNARNNNNKKEVKKKICTPPKEKQQPKKCSNANANSNTPSTATFTCPLYLTGSSQRSQWWNNRLSRSRGVNSNKDSLRISSSNDITKKEWDLNVNKGASKSKLGTTAARIASNKSAKSPSAGSTRPTTTVPDDENSFVQRVRETLRCPTCNDVITPPVYQCLIGHNICHKCKLARQDCSLCLSPLTDCRNFFAEELLYKTFQRCLYSKYGCKVCLPSAQMKSHEMVCDHAPFECPFNVCRTLLRSEDLLEHMKTHQISIVDKELKHAEVFVPRNPPGAHVCIIPNILNVEKVAFYPIIVQESDGSWLFYVITHNYPKYRFEFLIKKQAKTLAFQGPVISLRSNLAQVKLKGSGLVLTDRAVKSLKANENLNYQIRISKIDTVTDETQVKESTLDLPMSWVLTPRSGEIVSKTELFANKKTSVSPHDDSDEDHDADDDDDDAQSSEHRHDSDRDTSDTNGESDMDDIHSEDFTASGTSVATTNPENGLEIEYETANSAKSHESRESVRSISTPASAVAIARKSSEHSKSPQRSTLSPSLTSLSSSKKSKNSSSPSAPVQQQKPSPEEENVDETILVTSNEEATCSTTLAIDCDGVCSSTALLSTDNNSNHELNRRRSRLSMSTESLAINGNFPHDPPPLETFSSECDFKRKPESPIPTMVPISILKPSTADNSPQLLRNESSSSMHNLKMAPNDTFEVTSQSSSLISDPLLALPQKILKNGKRSRSSSKHRVRLSDQVICREVNDSQQDEDVNGNSVSAQKSQMNLRLLASRSSIRTVPSKHVLSVEIRSDGHYGQMESEPVGRNEFQQLKQALNAHNACSDGMFMEEVDLLTAKSLSEMKDAVISGSFDVVKSVMSLFASDSSEKSKEPKENGEQPSTMNELK